VRRVRAEVQLCIYGASAVQSTPTPRNSFRGMLQSIPA
jgi:hypothetical protein